MKRSATKTPHQGERKGITAIEAREEIELLRNRLIQPHAIVVPTSQQLKSNKMKRDSLIDLLINMRKNIFALRSNIPAPPIDPIDITNPNFDYNNYAKEILEDKFINHSERVTINSRFTELIDTTLVISEVLVKQEHQDNINFSSTITSFNI